MNVMPDAVVLFGADQYRLMLAPGGFAVDLQRLADTVKVRPRRHRRAIVAGR